MEYKNNIIKEMFDNKKINKGQPIVAIVFDSDSNILSIESNIPKNELPWNKIHETHAEYLCMDDLDHLKDYSKLNLIITTTPCNKCAKRIIDNFNFEKVYYLFEKFDDERPSLHIKFKGIKNIENINPKKGKGTN